MNEAVKKEMSLFTFLVIGYGFLYFLNNALTDSLYVVPGAHLVHLPSGIKILMVLVAGLTGSLAIAVVGFLWLVDKANNWNMDEWSFGKFTLFYIVPIVIVAVIVGGVVAFFYKKNN